jgi:hypothetical protein
MIMKKFVVSYAEINCSGIRMEVVFAESWEEAVTKHERYPFKASPDEIATIIDESDIQHALQSALSRLDCTMGWLELL